MQFLPRETSQLWRDSHESDRPSLQHLISLIAAITLSVAFAKNAWKYDLEWMDYIGYSVAMAMSASPALVSKFLGLKFPNGTAPTSGEQK